MTNYEKNKTQLDMYAVADISWGMDKDGKIFVCDSCTDCIFRKNILAEVSCNRKKLQWLQQEYKEPEVDWSKVPIDTPILVRVGEKEWQERHFAGYMFGKVGVFNSGSTSENFNSILFWDLAKLAEQEGEE